ncbi:MAG: hypothetical protein ACRCU2_28320 [Planktothrix sp.]
MRYFTPENAVTASMNLYRKRFKTYFKISLISYLWFLVPVYGWAKFYAGLALISRLAFSEINGKAETVTEAQKHINPQMWGFLLASISASIGFTLRALLWIILWSVSSGLLSSLLILLLGSLLAVNQGLIALFVVIFILMMVLVYAWFFIKLIEIYSPFFIYEIPLAIEEKITSSTTLSRSRQLIAGLRRSVVKTIVLPVLTTTPLIILSTILWLFISGLIKEAISPNSQESTSVVIEQVIWIIYWGSFNILLTPFWQTLKSMVYYNLRCQKEAFDLPMTLSSPISYNDAGDFMGMGSES